ncbi:MAG: T9SS type A sorting domain-containing protein [Bacteroidales bacterium]|jgi:hypothetical protein|nr:T9SS type A sorting domain-containing protein [Bacteroidales bacterium]
MNSISKFMIVATAICFTLVNTQVFAQKTINLNNENVVVNETEIPPVEFLKEAKAIRLFAFNPDLQNANRVNIGDFVTLQLFENQTYLAQVTTHVTDVNGTLALTLKFFNYPMAFAIITTDTEGKSLLNISIPELGKIFGSRYDTENKKYYLLEIDESKIERPHLDNDMLGTPEVIEEIENNSPKEPPSNDTKTLDCGPSAFSNPDTAATISLLVVYTDSAANSSYTSSHSGINNVIASMITLGNLCLSNSSTGITLTLAHSAQVVYTETLDMTVSLSHLSGNNDGYMDNVHSLRQQYNADLVQLLTIDNSSGGYGNVLTDTTGNISRAFSVCWVTQVGGTYPCSVHELGHNMGLGHGATMLNPGTSIFSYSHGWRWTGNTTNPYGTNKYCSVMSYWSGNNYADGIDGYNVAYFANPNVSYAGAATGDAIQADAARSLREIKHVIAYYSNRLSNLPDVPSNIVFTNPTNYGATVTWNSCNNAISYRVCIPTGNGGYVYWSTTNTSYILNSSTRFQPCNTYDIFIMAINECGDAVSSQTFQFNTFCSSSNPDCLNASYGQWPSTTFIPSCNGTDMTIATNCYAGEYSVVSITAGTTYTFSSSISTDFLTISNSAGNTVLATGTGLVNYTAPSSTTIRFYTHTNSNCGESNTNRSRIVQCGTIQPPTVTTLSASSITQTTATLNKTVTAGTETITSQGFKYKQSSASSWTDVTATSSSYNLSGLTANTQYQFYAYATTASGTTNGSTLTFTTSAIQPPTVTTLSASSITQTTATLNKTVTAGTETITSQGFKYKQSSASSWTDVTVTSSSYNLSGLTANTQYQFYAYATTASGTTNGSTLTFTTSAIQPPTVTTLSASSITQTTATLNKTVTAGTETITSQGFKYKQSSASSWTDVTATSSSYNLSGLTANTQYQFYAYATTASGTTNGSTLTFTTSATLSTNADLASLSVNGYSLSPSFNVNITSYSVTVPNSITTRTISATSADANATISGTGSTGTLTVGNNVRNVIVTAQAGNTKTYTITIIREAENIIPPTVTTLSASSITQTTAILNKTVTAGTETITSQGFKYRQSSASSWTDVTATSSSYNLSGLTANTQYQFYAYATTVSGTTDGNILTFMTLADNTTYTILASADSNGYINPNGSVNVLEGNSQIFNFGANSGYKIKEVFIDDVENGQAKEDEYYNFTNVTSNHTIVVTFEVINAIDDVTTTTFNVYPNPANDKLFIEGEGYEQIKIYDLLGKVVLTAERVTEIDISNFVNGVYNVRLLSNEGNVVGSKKIVKQ